MKEKLLYKFLSNYNVDDWNPCDVTKLHEYIEYCYFNKIDEEEMVEPIETSSLPKDAKRRVIECCKNVYGYLFLKNQR